MNGPNLVCAGCNKPTTLYKPICDECMRASGQEPRPERELVAEENAARLLGGFAPTSILLPLTEEQARLLAPHFEYVKREFERGRPGILAAQVGQNPAGVATIRVGFMPHESAKRFERAVSASG
jgi:hypothetical protein